MARPFRLRVGGIVKESRLWAVAALCLLQGSGWVLVQGWPSGLGYPFAGCIHFALIGCVSALVTVLQVGIKGSMRGVGGVSVAGVCMFVLPVMVARFATGVISDSTSTALFCSVPVMIVLIASYFGSGDRDESRIRGLLVPSLLALGGAVVLFSAENPFSARRWVWSVAVIGSCAAMAFASTWMYRGLRGIKAASAVAAISVVSAAVLGVCGVWVGWPAMRAAVIGGEVLRCIVFDLPVVWLTVWLMREVEPVRLSARFLLVPLLTVAEGYAAVWVLPDLRTFVAMVLVGGGGLLMLLRDEAEEVPGLGLR